MINTILTVINVFVAAALAGITLMYTRATRRMAEATKRMATASDRMANMEADRKRWEVQPIVVPFQKQLRTRARQFGIRNIGRGTAIVVKFKPERTKGCKSWGKNMRSYILPIFLPVGAEFIYTSVDEENCDFNAQRIRIEYEDIHGNCYITRFHDGVTENFLAESPLSERAA